MPFLPRLPSLALVAILAASCASKAEREPDFVDPEITPAATNPDGLPYPADHHGGAERTRQRPGDRFPNFAFRGYVDGRRDAGLQTISMADFYDPDQKRHKVLHVQVAATWCTYCSAELEATVRAKEQLNAEGVVFLEVVVSGNAVQIGPSLGEVDGWVDRHASTISTAIDVRARRMSSLGIDGTVMPWDILVDTRTMEILESSGGSPADIVKYDRDALAFVNANPPGY